jgi:site-specific DNA-methyltransferase (adenine-specific)
LTIDGFLKVNGKMIPIPIRIQRKNETIESAKQQLSKAIQKNGFKRAVLYQTNDKTESVLFTLPNAPDDRLYIYDTIDAIIRNKNVLVYER